MSFEALPEVPHIRESHGLYLDPTTMDAFVSVVAAPYPGMAAGDQVTFHFASSQAVTLTAEVGPDAVGLPVTWTLEGNDVWNAYTEAVPTHYEVTRAGTVVATSQVQVFTIIEGVPDTWLPPPALVDHEGADLDPEQFPEGVTVRVPLYAGAAVGDGVVMYWSSAQAAKSTLVWHSVTLADLDRGGIQMAVGPEWLQANIGSSITLTYQYARAGAAESSLGLTLQVLVPVVLAPPLVEGAEPEGDDGNGNRKGYLLAEKAHSGAFVNVPEAEEVVDAVALEVHWQGHPNGGEHVATAPHDPGRPLRFQIPRGVVAANMGSESRRFSIVYEARLSNGRSHRSKALLLWVKPVPNNDYAPAQCRQSMGKPGLSLSDVPPEGAEIFLTTWPLIEPGQLLTLWISGVASNGEAWTYTVRDAVPVTQGEITQRVVAGYAAADELVKLKVNEVFHLRAKVSYNGGDTAVNFPYGSVRWLG